MENLIGSWPRSSSQARVCRHYSRCAPEETRDVPAASSTVLSLQDAYWLGRELREGTGSVRWVEGGSASSEEFFVGLVALIRPVRGAPQPRPWGGVPPQLCADPGLGNLGVRRTWRSQLGQRTDLQAATPMLSPPLPRKLG